MEGNDQKVEANILVLGAENVGKSALTVKFLTRRFIGEYGDIESIYSHSDRIDGREVCFNIWDSSCSQNGSISDRQLRWADGFILVYSICDRQSFSVVRQQVQSLRQHRPAHVALQAPPLRHRHAHHAPVVIVGNKRDLQHRRAVSSEEGRLLALSADCGFFEISAAETYHGVLLVFHRLLGLIREGQSRGGRRRVALGLKGIVRSMSAVFGRRRTD